MKSKFKIIFLFGILLTVSCCKDNENKVIPEDRILEIKDLSYNGCKPVTNSSDTEEYIELQTVDSNYLHVKHVNAIFNCCPKEIIVEAKIENGKIIYNSFHKENGCHCYCLFDTYCKIGPLSFTKYTFIVNTYGIDEPIEFTLDFSQTTQEKYIIEREGYNYPAK